MKTLSYSVLLPTLNRPDLIRRFLKSLEVQTRPPKEVVLVDQSDDEKTKEVFHNWNPINIEKKYMHIVTKSLLLSRNAALDNCTNTDLVCFLDDDLILKPDYCEHIIHAFENDTDEKYAAGMGTIIGWEYKSKPFQTIFFMPREGNGKFQPGGAPTYPHWKKEFTETEYVSGGITFYRKNILHNFRYDEKLVGYGYCDDFDIAYRLSRQYKLFFEPKAECIHEPHAPGKEKWRASRKYWILNMYYLANKNGHSLPAFFWCIFGHMCRDIICRDFLRLLGDFEGIFGIINGEAPKPER